MLRHIIICYLLLTNLSKQLLNLLGTLFFSLGRIIMVVDLISLDLRIIWSKMISRVALIIPSSGLFGHILIIIQNSFIPQLDSQIKP